MENIILVFNCATIPNIVKTGIRSLTHRLDQFEHIEQKPMVDASNNNRMTFAKSSICTSKWHGLLSSNGMVQKKHLLDPSPHFFKAKPNACPPMTSLHMNTFA